MADDARHSDGILREARSSLVNNRDYGGRRRQVAQGAARIKRGHFGRKLRNVAFAVVGIWLGLSIIGGIISGIGFTGLAIGALATVAAVWIFGQYPKLKVPSRADINPASTDVKALVGRTELWLESQRRALPAPAVKLVDTIGLQLDSLGEQLVGLDQASPQAAEVRKLVGQYLPDMVDGYRKIPGHLRSEPRAGTTPEKQLLDGLQTISTEIDSVTRQLATGALDDLAIKTRYLEYKYGDAANDGAPS